MKSVSGEPKDDTDVRRILRLEVLDYRAARAIVEEHLGFATANRLDAMARDAGRPEVPPGSFTRTAITPKTTDVDVVLISSQTRRGSSV
jgi:hypothetical protein